MRRGREGIVVKLRRAHAIGPLAQLDLERADNGELIEAVIPNERFAAEAERGRDPAGASAPDAGVRRRGQGGHMNFQQLRSVREAARRNFNLTEVANALFTSQPGVSRQIRELEDELGVVIFERNGKRLTGLTDPGKGILKIIERLLVEAENLQQASQEYAAQDSGTLTIAVTHTQARYALPQVVQAFRNAFPNVRIALQQSAPEHIAEWVLSGKADIGIATEGLSQFPDLVSFPCYRWSHLVVVPDGHPLLANR
jgi:LysR family cys regulon transcriptional activator